MMTTKQKPLDAMAQAFVRGEAAKGDDNVHFADGVFYSYAEPIAERLSDRAVWITDRKFSTTTSRHTSALVYAAGVAGMEIIRGPKAPRQDPNLAPMPPISVEDARMVAAALREYRGAGVAADPHSAVHDAVLRRARALADVYEAAAAQDRTAVAGLYEAVRATGGK
jgi:hypothetical protein